MVYTTTIIGKAFSFFFCIGFFGSEKFVYERVFRSVGETSFGEFKIYRCERLKMFAHVEVRFCYYNMIIASIIILILL